MSTDPTVDALTKLLIETGDAHHQAFAATDGEDPDWPLWYAGYLEGRLPKLLQRDFTKSELVVALSQAEREHQARASDEPWAPFYARYFCERYTCEPNETLALYMTPSCPFCRRVMRVIDELNIDIEMRDIWENEEYRRELVEARGRATVPVLRCTSLAKDRWMPESADIIRHLRERFG